MPEPRKQRSRRPEASTFRSRWNTVGGSIAAILLLPFLIAAAILITVWRRSVRRRFWRRYRGKTLLIWHSRRGWHDFCINNVLPVLPPNVLAVHEPPLDPDLTLVRKEAEPIDERFRPARPYLLFAIGHHVCTLSLNEILLPYKAAARRSDEVRHRIRQILQHQIGYGRQTCCRAKRPV